MNSDNAQSKPTSHLVHVSELPSDSIAISDYGRNHFTNLFYSKATGKLYQRYPRRIREIETANLAHGSTRKIYVRNAEGHTVYISMKKLMKSIEAMPNDEEHPLEIIDNRDANYPDVHESEHEASNVSDDVSDEPALPKAPKKKAAAKTAKIEDTESKPSGRKGKPMEKIAFVKGPGDMKTQSQIGGIVNAQTALKEAKATKHRHWNKKKITLDDVKL